MTYYNDLGRIQEAMELGEKLLEVRQRTLDNEDSRSLKAKKNLAISCNYLGCNQEAIVLDKRVVEASQRTLGYEHPATLRALYTPVAVYHDLGRLQEAVELLERVIGVRCRTLSSVEQDDQDENPGLLREVLEHH